MSDGPVVEVIPIPRMPMKQPGDTLSLASAPPPYEPPRDPILTNGINGQSRDLALANGISAPSTVYSVPMGHGGDLRYSQLSENTELVDNPVYESIK